ncbi:Putative peptidoglycan bound protein (LPXTG motif) Lmo1799 homolog [Alloactinosynnema sp. L-07]|uniref:hypothetical protein n=1 Tax=Alloactinosynnema sp. L-07 TaxID=1653480 RepID=UPI00065EEFB1|nr:hypothetical protein [Alloactinosynnema sp. L-07]CRK60613.1 Putative peptidoglycan bound protein (LPXTG motif) Lmo1799 homolog [Alloactinosynnema sp. L-07]
MYVDETGADTTDTTADDTAGHDELTVEVGGEEYEVEENYDYDGDNKNDTAVVQTEDGYMAFTDTDGDGTADTMVQLDEEGNVTGAAEYDEASGEWAEADPDSVEAPSGDGADDSGSAKPASNDDDDDKPAKKDDDDSDLPTSKDDDGGSETITVDTKDGDVTAGPAEYDADGDGTNDTSVVTDEEGNTYAFTDADGDGEADQAIVVEADGDVTIAEHTGEDEWTTVETGHINADGSYESDSSGTPSGSDAAWNTSAGVPDDSV